MNKYDNEYRFKIIIVGDSSVGKTSIVHWFIFNKRIEDPYITIGASCYKKDITVFKDKHVKLDIWDTAGQERFKSIIKLYYKDNSACIYVFDLTNRKSFENLLFWINDYNSYRMYNCHIYDDPKTTFIIACNKSDLPVENWEVSVNEIKEFSSSKKCHYVFTDCVTGKGINELFYKLVEELVKSHNEHELYREKSNFTLVRLESKGKKCLC